MVDLEWSTNTDWTNAQSTTNIDINSGTFELADAIPDSVVDHYESVIYEDQNKSLSDFYSGDLASYQRQQSTVLEGSYSLEAPNVPQGDHIYSVDGDGLPRYPQKGEEFHVLMNPGSGAGMEIAFGTPPTGVTSINIGYTVRITTSNEFNIIKRNGSFNKLTTTSASFSTGSTYEVVVEWHDGSGSQPDNTIVATAYDYDTADQTRGTQLASISAQDSEFATNLGIGFLDGKANNPTNRYDLYEVLGSVP